MTISGLYPIVDLKAGATIATAASFLEAVLVEGVRVAQLRAKSVPDRAFLEIASACVEVARRRGVKLLVNDRADIAAAAGADGVHVGADDLPIEAARRVLGGKGLVGTSTDSPEEARAAAAAGADYVAWGAVFPTATKTDAAPQDGPAALARVRAAIPGVPLVAIGGITAARVADIARAGADAFAVVGALRDAADPHGEALRLVDAWREAAGRS